MATAAPSHLPLSAGLFLLLAGCGGVGGAGGGGVSPIGSANAAPELLACRSRVESEMSFSEIALRTGRNLGTSRVADRSGIERRARLHPDGKTVVFARQRRSSRPESRELFTSTIDGSRPEARLTVDSTLDDEPCWSPAGDAILFASERSGSKALWLCDADGRNPRPLLLPPAGSTDGEPDWSVATGRIVFSRRSAAGTYDLWLVQPDGSGEMPLTSGAGTAPGLGDRDPTFSPDGTAVAFARVQAQGAALCTIEVASGALTTLYQTAGTVGLPRFTPSQDRLLFGLAEPNQGRQTLRLAEIPAAGGTPALVWPDERYRLEGIDFLPGMPSAAAVEPPEPLDVTEAEVRIVWGGAHSPQSVARLGAEDGVELIIGTSPSGVRQVAGIRCAFALPVADPVELASLRVRVIARITRTGGDSALRLSVHNPTDGRYDTAVEIEPQSTGSTELTFSTTSLRHVARDGSFRFHVIGDLEHGDPAELAIDLVEVFWTQRSPATVDR